jgi:hypothetical protein
MERLGLRGSLSTPPWQHSVWASNSENWKLVWVPRKVELKLHTWLALCIHGWKLSSLLPSPPRKTPFPVGWPHYCAARGRQSLWQAASNFSKNGLLLNPKNLLKSPFYLPLFIYQGMNSISTDFKSIFNPPYGYVCHTSSNSTPSSCLGFFLFLFYHEYCN